MSARFAYDDVRGVTTMTDGLGHSTEYHHDERLHLLRVVDPLGFDVRTVHDAYGRLLSRTDELGNTYRFTLGAHGRPSARGPARRHRRPGRVRRRPPAGRRHGSRRGTLGVRARRSGQPADHYRSAGRGEFVRLRRARAPRRADRRSGQHLPVRHERRGASGAGGRSARQRRHCAQGRVRPCRADRRSGRRDRPPGLESRGPAAVVGAGRRRPGVLVVRRGGQPHRAPRHGWVHHHVRVRRVRPAPYQDRPGRHPVPVHPRHRATAHRGDQSARRRVELPLRRRRPPDRRDRLQRPHGHQRVRPAGPTGDTDHAQRRHLTLVVRLGGPAHLARHHGR